MKQLSHLWSQRGLGIDLNRRKLTNSSDDLLLAVPSLQIATEMLQDSVVYKAGKFGLQVYGAETKIIWNGQDDPGPHKRI